MDARPIYIRDGAEMRMIGFVKEQKLYKRVKGSKHLFKKLDAWGIDAEKWKELSDEVKEVRVLDEETNTVYSVEPETISTLGRYFHFKPHRAQIFLPRHYWNQTRLA